jgi:LUC7 N_terminus
VIVNVSNPISLQRELQQLTDTSGASGHQKLRVCDVCGAYLSVLDSDRRLADHFGGKVSCESNGISHAQPCFSIPTDTMHILDAFGIS